MHDGTDLALKGLEIKSLIGSRVILGSLVFGLTSGVPLQLSAQTLSEDPFVAAVAGEWEGRGTYEGNTLTLTRSWTLELGDRFLRADMQVGMPNGSAFGALMYWSRISPGTYEVLWMDGTGRRQMLSATRDAVTGVVATTFLDEFAESGPEWRTWEFESSSDGAYVERLFRVLGDGRELLTTFSFTRGR